MIKIIELDHFDSPSVLAPLVEHFSADPVPPTDRDTRTWVAATEDGIYAATAIVRMDDESRWHLWYMGVLNEYQQQGIGTELLSEIESAARHAEASALRTRTYSRWVGMRRLLTKRGWAFVNAVLGEHYDGVEEEWLLPLRGEPLRLVLVGANKEGRGGELYKAVLDLPSLVQLVGVCDSNPQVLQAWDGVPTSTNIDDLLNDVTADAAILALPHSAYRKVRPSCLRHGLGILHEKPLACELSELLELQDEMTSRRTPLVVGVQRRSHPSYIFLKRAFQEDPPHSLVVRMSLGRSLQELTAVDESPEGPWRNDFQRAGGGALIDIGYHAIDLVHFLLDAPLITIACNLWVADKPAMGGELETAATLVGRCGKTWVRMVVDRAGQKSESVIGVGRDTWEADRERVLCNSEPQFSCPGSWEMAVRGRIAAFVIACSSAVTPVNLWDHLSGLRVIEQARTLARVQGLGDVGDEP